MAKAKIDTAYGFQYVLPRGTLLRVWRVPVLAKLARPAQASDYR
jgi:hypothetical protein